MALARRHWRFIVRDAYGYVVQNAKVNVYQPGTTNNFLGAAYDAASGGNAVTNPLTTNAQGEVEAWFDTEQSVDVQIDDNTDAAYRAVEGVSVPFSFATYVEKSKIDYQPEDVLNVEEALLIGSNHGASNHDATASDNPHGAADHTDVVRSLFLPVHDGVVLDGGTLASLGTLPDTIRTISLADAATSGALWAFEVPGDWVSGNMAVEIYFAGATTTGGNVRFQVVAKKVAEGASVIAAGTTFTQTSQAPTTANLLVIEPALDFVTPVAAGELVMLSVRRLGADGADTYAAAAHLIGVRVTYTANQ
jgi:hypothetical protein